MSDRQARDGTAGGVTTEVALLEAIYRLHFPAATPEELAGVLQKRAEAAVEVEESVESVVATKDELELVCDEIGDEDLAEEVGRYKRSWAAAADAKAAKMQQLASILATREEAAAAPEATRRSDIRWVPGRGLLPHEAKAYLPPGCTIAKDTTRHMRWQVRGDWLVPSHSKAFTNRTAHDENESLLYCLRMSWNAYERLHGPGGKCPWDLDCSLFE